ncbi:hypothetical protein AGMMS49925_10300 [Deltaproteobacteria bacterium]|nr:hypothetical protein AGMMS49925_10300 [Deltaproteobacteria bacterium]
MDKLSRNEEIQEKLRITDWDLIVCDEAHKMSATVWGGEIKTTIGAFAGGYYPPFSVADGNTAQR